MSFSLKQTIKEKLTKISGEEPNKKIKTNENYPVYSYFKILINMYISLDSEFI